MNQKLGNESSEPCPYFQTQVVSPRLVHWQQPLNLCLTHCRLADEMRRRLEPLEAAKSLVDALTITSHDCPPRFFCGADLEPPAEPICTMERLRERCIPSFENLLTVFHLDPNLPHESSPSEI